MLGNRKNIAEKITYDSLEIKARQCLVPKELTFPSVLTKQCALVPDMVDRWHHLVLLSLQGFYSNWILYSPGEIRVN